MQYRGARGRLRAIKGGANGNLPPPPQSPRHGKKLTQIQRYALHEVIRTLIFRNQSEQQVVDFLALPESELKHLPALSDVSARKHIEIVLREMYKYDDQESTQRKRVKQLKRLEWEAAQAGAAKQWNAVASIELLIARMSGTLEPERVVHSFTMGDAMYASLASRTDEEVRELEGEQLLIEEKARLYDAIDTEGTPVPPGPPALPQSSAG